MLIYIGLGKVDLLEAWKPDVTCLPLVSNNNNMGIISYGIVN
jgi:hypothetical protein